MKRLWSRAMVSALGLLIVVVGAGGVCADVNCLSELQGPVLNYPLPPKRAREVRCVDGDQTCDVDGVANGVCQFDVSICFNPAVAECSSAGVASYVVKNRPPLDPRYNDDLAGLQAVVDGVGLPTTQALCTQRVPVRVGLRGRAGSGVLRAGKMAVVGKAVGLDGTSDRDVMKLQCLPGKVPDGCAVRSTKKLMAAMAGNDRSRAALQDSWLLADELGYRALSDVVVECPAADGARLFTVLLSGDGSGAQLSVLFRPDSGEAWAPIMLAEGPLSANVGETVG